MVLAIIRKGGTHLMFDIPRRCNTGQQSGLECRSVIMGGVILAQQEYYKETNKKTGRDPILAPLQYERMGSNKFGI